MRSKSRERSPERSQNGTLDHSRYERDRYLAAAPPRPARLPTRYLSLRTLLLALGLDMLLAPYTAVSIDSSVWLQTTSNGFLGLRLYERPGFAYPPVVGDILVVLGRVVQALGIRLSALYSNDLRLRPLVHAAPGDFTTIVASPAFNLMSKSIAAVPQIVVAMLIVYAARRCGGTDRRARLAGAAWLFNPLVLSEVGLHGATTDLFVALFSLLAAVLVIDDKPGWAGASLAVGALTKITPLFVAPALIAAVARRHESADHVDLKAVTRFALGGAAAICVFLAPEAISGSLGAMNHSAFSSRADLLPGVGGLSLYGVRSFGAFSGLTSFVFAHSGAVISITTILDLLIAVGAGVWVFRVAPERRAYATIAGPGVVYLAILVTSPDTAPQYLLWCLPFVIVAVGVWRRSFAWPTVLGASGCLFLLALDGPLSTVIPLATYSSVLSMHHLLQSTLHWIFTPARLWGESNAGDFLAVCVLVAVGAMVELARELLQVPPRGTARDPSVGGPVAVPASWRDRVAVDPPLDRRDRGGTVIEQARLGDADEPHRGRKSD